MFWLLAAFAIPIIVAFKDGSTYLFALSISGFGVVLYIVNITLIQYFIAKKEPTTLENGSWEQTAGKGIVPKWVSQIGLIGIGFVPAGLIIVILLFFELIANIG